MTPIKNLTDPTRSNKANAEKLGLHPEQLKRWLDNDAHVKSDGTVYIRTKGIVAGCVDPRGTYTQSQAKRTHELLEYYHDNFEPLNEEGGNAFNKAEELLNELKGIDCEKR